MSFKVTPTEAASLGERKHAWLSPKRVLLMFIVCLGVFRLLGSVESSYPLLVSSITALRGKSDLGQVVRQYSLDLSQRWMNPDGGRWRVMIVCNGETPCPLLTADEGDIVEITVHNDLYAQSSIHWSGRTYKHTGPWNDGTPGISQFPMLPRGNWTSRHDTQGSWGLSWYAEHASAGSADGLYGLVYVAPSPTRPRPYRMITQDPVELKLIQEAEYNAQHLVVKSHQHRDSNWKLLRMRAEGSEFYCYDSILINGKGRVHCLQPGYEVFNGHRLDETGCIQPAGLPDEKCSPSEADYHIIETNGHPYIMLNLLNSGFEHSVRISIDGHDMFVVANDAGFVEPQKAQAIYVPSAGRVTVLIKLDQEPGEYAMRIASTSQLQNLQGFAILRYQNARHIPKLGLPMELPAPASDDDICVLPDGSVKDTCVLVEANFAPPYPPSLVPSSSQGSLTKRPNRSAADFTFHLSAGTQPSQTEPHAPEYFLNAKPWQLFHSSITPLLFDFYNSSADSPEHQFADPIISDHLPVGSVVDFIIENQLNDTIPLYKHGEPFWLLGSGAHARFPHNTVHDAVEDTKFAGKLNLQTPGRAIVHDLPPMGWSVIQFQVVAKEVTMLHAVKLRYFVLGMSVPIIEGFGPEDFVDIPEYASKRPHIEFAPKNDGVFG